MSGSSFFLEISSEIVFAGLRTTSLFRYLI